MRDKILQFPKTGNRIPKGYHSGQILSVIPTEKTKFKVRILLGSGEEILEEYKIVIHKEAE